MKYFIPRGSKLYYTLAGWSSLQRYGATLLLLIFFVGLWWFMCYKTFQDRITIYENRLAVLKIEQAQQLVLEQKIEDSKQQLRSLRDNLHNWRMKRTWCTTALQALQISLCKLLYKQALR
jgi:hypothetical protein